MSKCLATRSHHVIIELVFKLGTITLVLKFNEVRILHRKFKLAASLLKCVDDIVSAVILAFITDKDPFIFFQIYYFLNGQLSESILVTSDELVPLNKLRSFKHVGLHGFRF